MSGFSSERADCDKFSHVRLPVLLLNKLVEGLCLLKASMQASLHIYDPWHPEDGGAGSSDILIPSTKLQGIIYQNTIISTKGCPK